MFSSPVEQDGCLDHDVEKGGQHRVVVRRLVEVLLPGAQGQASLVQLARRGQGLGIWKFIMVNWTSGLEDLVLLN